MLLPPQLSRCIDKTSSPFGCWLWTASTRNGYGQVIYKGKNWSVHRLVWVLVRGPIPKRKGKKKLCVLHNCPGGDNRQCCRPRHLWLGTGRQNIADMIAKGRQATGERCGARGDRNGSRTHPESRPRGKNHYRAKHPEVVLGERNYNAKLTEIDVRAIREQYSRGGISVSAIARIYSRAIETIRCVVTRQTWDHVK
jgi:hypothetical protein